LIDEAFDRKAWHGPTLRGALRGVTAKQAAWRPAPGAHNIWELTVHAAYWKYAVRRMLAGDKRGSFPVKGSNWFERPATRGGTSSKAGARGVNADAAWRADVQLLLDEHRSLRKAIVQLNATALDRRALGKAYSLEVVIRGIAAHDLYHAGQVQLLKRLYKATSSAARRKFAGIS
jgi:hypothetical protein